MSDASMKFAGGTAAIEGVGATNPAVLAILQASFSTPNLPSLNFTQATSVESQSVGSIDRGGSLGIA